MGKDKKCYLCSGELKVIKTGPGGGEVSCPNCCVLPTLEIINLNSFQDGRGFSVFDMFPDVKKLEELQVNMSMLYPGVIKAFHRHMVQTDRWIIIRGAARVITVAEDIPEIHHLTDRKPQMLIIPPKVWHGLKAVGTEPCTLLYLLDRKYNPQDEIRTPWDNFGREIWKVDNE